MPRRTTLLGRLPWALLAASTLGLVSIAAPLAQAPAATQKIDA